MEKNGNYMWVDMVPLVLGIDSENIANVMLWIVILKCSIKAVQWIRCTEQQQCGTGSYEISWLSGVAVACQRCRASDPGSLPGLASGRQAEAWWRASIWRSHRKVVIKQCSYHNNIIDIQNRLPYSKVVYPAIIVLFSCLMEVNHGVRTGPDYPFR